jgi:hypothetical protein
VLEPAENTSTQAESTVFEQPESPALESSKPVLARLGEKYDGTRFTGRHRHTYQRIMECLCPTFMVLAL